uniref:Titin n=1 Tax=Podarcis muralis TaxID=64176 RepID=A0A670HZ06_PODMU
MKASFTNVIETQFAVTGLVEDQRYEFRVIARNAAGVFSEPSESSGAVTARDEVEPPRISMDPKFKETLVLHAGESFKIDADVHGKPLPSIQWLKGDKELVNTARLDIKTTDFATSLSVKEATRVDSGHYVLLAKNAAGEKTASVHVKVLDKPGPPEGPVVVTGVTAEKCYLAWKPPLQDGGSDILHYVIERRETNYLFRVMAVNEKGRSDPRSLAVPITAKDLVIEPDVRPAFHSYSIQVGQDLKVEIPISGRPIPTITWTKDGMPLKQTTRVNVIDSPKLTVLSIKEVTKEDSGAYEIAVANVVGQKSAAVEIITLDKPDPPKDAIVVNAGETFRLEADVHGKPIPTILWLKGDKVLEDTARCEVRNTDFKALITVKDAIRVDGGQYILQASNVAGTKSVPITVKVLDRPGPPESIQVSGVTADKCSLTWAQPIHDGGSDISHYIIEKRETSRLAWTVVASDAVATMLKVTKLLEGNEYIFRIMAVNKYGVGEPLESAPVLMKNPFVVPGPPKSIEVTNVTKDSMTVCWHRPDSDGGSEIVNYIVEKRDRAGIRWVKCNKRRITDLRLRVTGLAEDHEYEFRVSAENAAGVGEPSQITPFWKACDPMFKPGPPTNAHAVDTTKNSITVAWGKPIYDGGSEILGYIVEICKADEEEWTIALIQDTKYKSDGLEEGLEYEFRVAAENIVGIGKVSKSSELYVARDACDPPGRPDAIVITRNYITLKWKKPEYDGGSRITGYVVEKRELPEGRWMKASFTNVTETEFTVTGLVEDQRYEFRVIARNAAGSISEPSESTGPIIARDEIEAPRASLDPKYKDVIVVHAGETFALEADIHGKPIPDIIWSKDGKNLKEQLQEWKLSLPLREQPSQSKIASEWMEAFIHLN